MKAAFGIVALLGVSLCSSRASWSAVALPSAETLLRGRNHKAKTGYSDDAMTSHEASLPSPWDATGIGNEQDRELLFNVETVNVSATFRNEIGESKCKSKAVHVNYVSNRFMVIDMEITPEAMEELRNDHDIESIEVADTELHVEEPEIISEEEYNNDEDRSRHLADLVTWGIKAIQADQVLPRPDPTLIKVCVVDTGYDNGHVDLPVLNETKDGYRNYGQDWFVDVHGHGTHIAGTIASLQNDQGIVGVFPNVSLFIAKGLRNDGTGDIVGVMDAIEECIDNGARVINLSLSGSRQTKRNNHKEYLKERYQDEHNSVLFVAPAGNDGDNSKSYPASYPAVMSVTATKSDNTLYPKAQWNKQVEISAPGMDIWSAVPDTVEHNGHGYVKWSGASIATAYVSGAAALVWSHNPSCTAEQIRRILLATTLSLQDASGSDCNKSFGRGLVQVKAAVDLLLRDGCGAADHLPLLSSSGLNSDGTCASYTTPPPTSSQTLPAPSPAPQTSTMEPSFAPSSVPSQTPSSGPPTNSAGPASNGPSDIPKDTSAPSTKPTQGPSLSSKTIKPSNTPSNSPSKEPSFQPSTEPSPGPSGMPSTLPSASTTTSQQDVAGGSNWVNLTYDNFEAGWGNFTRLRTSRWKDRNAHRIASYRNSFHATFIPSGSACLRIRDSGNYASVFLRESYNVIHCSKLQVSFEYYPRHMDNSDEFLLEYSSDGGSSWVTLKTYTNDVDFDNGSVHEDN